MEIPIIQSANFDVSQLFESVVNSHQQSQSAAHHVKVLKQQQIDLIVYIVKMCYLKTF